MNKFNIKRFAHLVRCDISGNRKAYLRYLGLLFISILLIESIWLFDDFCAALRGSGERCMNLYNTSFLSETSLVIFYIYALVGLNLTFSCLGSKAQRTSYLMIPATQHEKLLSRLLIFTLIWWIGGFIAWQMVDITRWLIFSLLGVRNEPILMYTLNKLSHEIRQMEPHWATFMLGLVPSFYLLGSSLFKRKSLVYTTLFFIACMIITFFFLGFLIDEARWRGELSTYSEAEDAQNAAICLMLIFTLATIFHLVCTYLCFRRTQVISRRWF